MANRLIERVTTSRGGAIAVGIAVALIAAILLIVYISRYKSSLDAEPVPVLIAKRVIEKGTPGAVVQTKSLYQSTTVKPELLQPGAINDPAALSGRLAVADIYPGTQLTLNNFSAEASGALNAQIVGPERGVTLAIDAVRGSLANVASGDHVDIYTQVTRNGRLVIQLFRSDVTVLQAPGAAGGNVVLKVRTGDAANVLFAATQTTLYFVIRPASGAAPTATRLADLSTVVATSRAG